MTQAKYSQGMSRGSITRLILRYSYQAALGLIAIALYNIVDRLFLGHYTGADGLGAVGLTFPFTTVVVSFGTLIGVGGASLISRLLGAQRKQDAEGVLGMCILMMIVFSAVGTAAGLWKLDFFVKAMGASDHLAPLVATYTRILLYGLPFNLSSFALNYMVRAEGRPGYAMKTLAIGSFANIVLDWLFISHFEMGVAGAAWGTMLAQVTAFIWVAAFYVFKKGILGISRRSMRFDWPAIREISLLGASPFSMNIFYTLTMVLFNNMVNRIGGDLAVSAMGIFFCLDNMIYIPVYGIGEGLQPIVGFNYGAEKYDRVKRAIITAEILGTIYFVFSFIVSEIWAHEMASIFVTANEPLVALSARAMRIGYLGMPFATGAIVAASAFMAIGRSDWSLALNFCRHGLLFLPGLIILAKVFGLDGTWASFIVVDAGGGFLGLAMLWYKWAEFSGEEKAHRKVRIGSSPKEA